MHTPRKLIIKNLLSHKETIFEFSQGKAILVVGKNNDKEGQKGNGSGKSGIGEAISLAVTGTSIRDALVRELITRGEVSCEITFILENRKTGKNFIIWRKFYSSTTKSSECKLWIGDITGEDEIRTCSDVNEYNKFILKTLGISRDDFYNFYLVTKERYSPFLSTSDPKKKEIINRFSGADSIDVTKIFIDEDSNNKGSEISVVDNNISTIQGRLNLLEEQKEAEKERFSDEKLLAQKNEIEAYILKTEGNIFQKKTDRSYQSSILREAVLERKTLIEDPDIQKTIVFVDRWRKKCANINNSLSLKRKDNSLFEERIKEIKELEQVLTEEDAKIEKNTLRIKEDITKLEGEKTNITNQIQGAITCPKCSYEFSVRFKDFDIEKARQRLTTLSEIEIPKLEAELNQSKQEKLDNQELWSELSTQMEDVNKDVLKRRELIDADITRLSLITDSLTDLERKVVQNRRDFEGQVARFRYKVSDAFSNYKRYSSSLKLEIQNLTQLQTELENLTNKDLTRLNQIEAQIKNEQEESERLKEKLDTLTQEKVLIDQWTTNFKSFKSFLANQSIKDISDYTNLFLDAIKSNITIQIEGYKTLAGGKLKEEISTTVLRDGFPLGSFGVFSAGERGRVEICVILALRELVNLNSPTGGLDLLVCDEILDSVDSLGLEYLIDSLQILNQVILVVSQNEINALSSSTLTIEKTNGVSSIVI